MFNYIFSWPKKSFWCFYFNSWVYSLQNWKLWLSENNLSKNSFIQERREKVETVHEYISIFAVWKGFQTLWCILSGGYNVFFSNNTTLKTGYLGFLILLAYLFWSTSLCLGTLMPLGGRRAETPGRQISTLSAYFRLLESPVDEMVCVSSFPAAKLCSAMFKPLVLLKIDSNGTYFWNNQLVIVQTLFEISFKCALKHFVDESENFHLIIDFLTTCLHWKGNC